MLLTGVVVLGLGAGAWSCAASKARPGASLAACREGVDGDWQAFDAWIAAQGGGQ